MVSAVRAQLESLLFEPILKPVESAFGEYGEIAVSEFSKALAQQMESRS